MKKTLESNDRDALGNPKYVTSLYDESVEVVGADDVLSPPSTANSPVLKSQPQDRKISAKVSVETKSLTSSWQKKNRSEISYLSAGSENSEDEEVEDEEDDEGDDDGDDDDDVRAPIVQGAYDPSDYEQLAVSEEIKDIFGYITKYIPQNIDLENKLWPFLPEFIPAVGDIDAFIKVSRPDGVKNSLGLTVLDEPCTQQSDPAVLQLQLRAVARESSAKTLVVKKVENAEKNGKSIEKWIKAISDLHSTKPSATIQYSKPMPNIDSLMQEWPPELEEHVNMMAIPSPDLDCDLRTYVTIICNLFDIPVYENEIQSLHAFFSLYSNVKHSQEQLSEQRKSE